MCWLCRERRTYIAVTTKAQIKSTPKCATALTQRKWKCICVYAKWTSIWNTGIVHVTWFIVFSICTRPRLGKVVLMNSTIDSRFSCCRIRGLWLPRRLKATLKMTSDPWRNSMSGRQINKYFSVYFKESQKVAERIFDYNKNIIYVHKLSSIVCNG